MASPYDLPYKKNFKYKMLGSITFMAQFQLHLFALIAKPARDLNLELLKNQFDQEGFEVK